MLSGCGADNDTVKTNSFDTEAESSVIGDKLIAENENFTLEFNEVTMGVILTEKATGKVYGTNPIDEGGIQYDELGMPIKRHPQLESVLFIKYLDTKTNNTSEMISYNAAVSNGRTTFEKIQDGVQVNYYFDDAEIMVPVTYTLRENGVALGIDPGKIQENSNMLITASLAPFFCSVENTEKNGYLFYPSGSGTLIYPKEISQPGESYSAEVYGEDASKEKWDKVATEKGIRLPVFGAKFGSQAVFGIIEQGAESSLIDIKAGATSIGYSGVYVTYQLRGFTANIKELYNNRYYKGNVYSDLMVEAPLSVGYYPLSDDKANYSAMAETYRDYLDRTAGKAESPKVSTLDLSFVGGAMIQKSFVGIPYETLFATTTLSDAKNILEGLCEKGVKPSNITLMGFGQNGIDSDKLGGGFKLDKKLGDKSSLLLLSESCKEQNAALYYDFNIVSFTKTANGYNSYFDAAQRANKKVAKLYNFDIAVLGRDTENAGSLLARDRIESAAEEAFRAAEKWQLGGVGFSSLSSIAYSDYSDKQSGKYYAKAGIAEQVSKIYGKEGISVMSSDANAYAAASSDLILSIPTFSSGAYLFDEYIPFYAMAMRGRSAISAESINLSTDSKTQLLRSVESGAGIAYTVTKAYSTKLLDSTTSLFYNSLYTDLSAEIQENYGKVADYYEKIGSSKIKTHTILENGLRETVFDNGVRVLVNYSDTELADASATVDAMSFLVEEAGV